MTAAGVAVTGEEAEAVALTLAVILAAVTAEIGVAVAASVAETVVAVVVLVLFLFFSAVKGEVALVDELEARRQSWLTYEVKLKRIIKRGRSNFRRGDVIEFKKRGGCKCPDLVVGKEFIFMANEEGSLFVLDARSLVLPWEKRRKNKLLLEDLRARVASNRRCRN